MIFIDTGAFIAKYVKGDQFHLKARKIWSKMDSLPCVTSQDVLNEIFTLLARKTDYAFAAERAANLYASNKLKVLRTGDEEEREAIRFLKKYADQKVSFTDALSFALMKKHSIYRVFSFDGHFALMNFEVLS